MWKEIELVMYLSDYQYNSHFFRIYFKNKKKMVPTVLQLEILTDPPL